MLPGAALSPFPSMTTVRCVDETFNGALIETLGVALKSPVTFTESDAEPLFTQAALTVGIELGVDEAFGVSVPLPDPLHPVSANARPTAAAVVASKRRRVARGTCSILPHETLMAA